MAEQRKCFYEFGPFRVDPVERLLLREGQPVPIKAKVFDILVFLIQERGHLIEKPTLMRAIWGESIIEESNLTVSMSLLRKALIDDGNEHKYIQTVHRHGYRFVAEVHEVNYPPEIPTSRVALAEPSDKLSFRPSRNFVRLATGFAALACTVSAAAFLHFRKSTKPHSEIQVVTTPVSIQSSRAPTARLPRQGTENPDAYLLYLKGRYFWNKRTEEGMRRSIEYFQQAIIEDEHYPSAYSGLADSYLQLSNFGIEPSLVAYADVKAAALKAVELDSTSAEAHSSLAMVSFYYEWNWSDAERELKRSIELDPNYTIAHTRYAQELVAEGRFEEAFVQERKALELDPLSLDLNLGLARIYYMSRNYAKAVETIRKVVDLDPLFARAHSRLGTVYLVQRNFNDSLREFEEAQRISGADPYLEGLLGYVRARSGDSAGARRVLERLTKQTQQSYVPAASMALVCIGLGDLDNAVEWLNKAYEDRSTLLVYAKVDPLFDPVRSKPHFSELINKMGLASR